MIAFLLLASIVIGLSLCRWPWYVGLTITVLSLIFAFWRFKKKGIALFVISLCLGGLVSLLDMVEPEKKESFSGVVVSASDNYYLLKSGIHKFYVYEEDNKRECGDILKLTGTIEKVSLQKYESRFDFERYLFDKGVRYEIKVVSTNVIFANPLRINERKDRFLSSFDEQTRDLIDALLFSRKNYDSLLINQTSSLNIIFLFSMCGIYLRSLLGFFEYLFGLKLSDKNAKIFSLLLVLPLYVISMQKVAVHRVFLCYGGRIINDHYIKKKLHYATLVSLLGLLFLIYDYHLAFQLSFLLGYGLSYLIIFLRSSLNAFHRKKRFVVLPIFLFAFLLPLHVANSGEIHIFQIVFQYIAIPLNLVFFLISAFSFYVVPITGVLSFLANLLTTVYSLFIKMDITMVIGQLPSLFYVVYYALFFYLPYLLESHRFRHSKVVGIMMATSLLVTSFPIGNAIGESIHFINVGQGDAILIQSHNKNILVDTGGSLHFDMAEEVLIPFLKKRKVYSLDVLITTHDDFDHNGAKISLMDAFPVRKHVDNRESFPLQIDNLTLRNLNNVDHEEDNDNSLVITFSLLNYQWLLMGDASQIVENEIVHNYPELDADYLKVSHHGSKTATSEEFLRKLTIKEAIISVGAHNYYGHPHQEVLERLDEYDVTIRRTDLEGTISFYRSLF